MRTLSVLLTIAVLVSLAACGNEAEEPQETTEQETTLPETLPDITSAKTDMSSGSSESKVTAKADDAEPTQTTEPKIAEALSFNFLTGEPVESGETTLARPTAVVVNNLSVAARYQSGLSSADIIFEVEVEGGITRLLAVFGDPADAGTLGSIRSARPVMVGIVLGLDAYFVHSGGSDQAYSEIRSYGVPDIDGMKKYSGYFYYDDAIVNATSLEHGYFTSGEKIASAVESYNESASRTEIKAGYNELFDFYAEPSELGGGAAAAVTTVYGGYRPKFVYSEETGKYLREQYGAPHRDFSTGEQLAFENVIVLSVESSVIKGDSAGRRQFDDVGSGVGILASRGTYINIKWEKETYDSPLVMTTEDGLPLCVNIGKTFISYVNGESNISVSAE